MDDIVSSPPSPNIRKRPLPDEESPGRKPLNLKGTQFIMPTPPDTEESSNASPSASKEDGRAASPAPSSSALSSVELFSSHVTPGTSTADAGAAPASNTGQPPAKRRKLTMAEKEQQRRAREAKVAEKAEKQVRQLEEKARKDEEKAKKDEEKRSKDEERRKKAEEKEAKKREKELEEERKSQDKLKKERSQMRLGAFFQKPATPARSPAAVEGVENPFGSARRKSLSLEPFDAVADQLRRSESPSKATPHAAHEKKIASAFAKAPASDYHKYFLPFELPSHTSLAQSIRRQPLEDCDDAQAAFDHELNDPSIQEKHDLGLVQSYASVESHFSDERQFSRGRELPVARHLIEQIQGSSQKPIDLTVDEPGCTPTDVLRTLSLRHLQFHEDVRPAYFGTYSKIRSLRAARRLRRNPFARERKDTDYDYDSEAEWEETEEGEDIDLGDDDDEAESLGDADEMDGFLDDENDELKNRRKMITGDLQPVSTGICWENRAGKSVPSIDGDSTAQEMRNMRMHCLLPSFSGKTIDPFSTAYWEPESFPTPAPLVQDGALNFLNGRQAQTRPPLKDRPNSNGTLGPSLVGAAQGEKGPITTATAAQSSKPGRKAAPKALSKEDLDEFKEAVIGSPLGKLELSKGLKARYVIILNRKSELVR